MVMGVVRPEDNSARMEMSSKQQQHNVTTWVSFPFLTILLK
jgi:hypothetical protein